LVLLCHHIQGELIDHPWQDDQRRSYVLFPYTSRTQADDLHLPFDRIVPEKQVNALFKKYKGARFAWVQEEPANMGALFYTLPRLRHIAGERSVLSVKRSASPSPSTGSAGAHEVEQKTLLALAFSHDTE